MVRCLFQARVSELRRHSSQMVHYHHIRLSRIFLSHFSPYRESSTLIMSSTPLVFFYLTPMSAGARNVVDQADQTFTDQNVSGQRRLRIGFNHIPKTQYRLLSFGTDATSCDILLPEGFPPKQCHFWINGKTGYILLRDDSQDQSTSLDALVDVPTETKIYQLPAGVQPRQRVLFVSHRAHIVRMSIEVSFLMSWDRPADSVRALANTHNMILLPVEARAMRHGRVYEKRRLRYKHIRSLVHSSSARVDFVVDLNTGDSLAVKTCTETRRHATEKAHIKMAREMRILKYLNHVRIELSSHTDLVSAPDLSDRKTLPSLCTIKAGGQTKSHNTSCGVSTSLWKVR